MAKVAPPVFVGCMTVTTAALKLTKAIVAEPKVHQATEATVELRMVAAFHTVVSQSPSFDWTFI